MTNATVVEVEITVFDDLYYVSRESGDRFGTEPFLMHTALYYAFNWFPVRFRVSGNKPVYRTHRDESDMGRSAFIHPAVGTDIPGYETRRFAITGDVFRTSVDAENKNMLDTGHQKTIRPPATFHTYIVSTEDDAKSITDSIPHRCRVGKKLSPAKVRTTTHTAEITDGEFELGQPLSLHEDLNLDKYTLLGRIRWQKMMPVDLIVGGRFDGPHLTVNPEFTNDTDVALPTETLFLGHGDT